MGVMGPMRERCVLAFRGGGSLPPVFKSTGSQSASTNAPAILFNQLRSGWSGRQAAAPPMRCLLGALQSVLLPHQMPQPILVKPNGIGIVPDELVYIHAVDGWRAPHALLLAVDKNGHELRAAPLTRSFLCCAELALEIRRRSPHPSVAKCRSTCRESRSDPPEPVCGT